MAQPYRRVRKVLAGWECHCQWCGYVWFTQRPAKPKTCARCRVREWWRAPRFRHHSK